MKKLRLLNYKNIFIKSVIYRIFIIGIQALFTYLYVDSVVVMDYQRAVEYSVWWNLSNIIIYFLYECLFAKFFNVSKDEGFVIWATGVSGVGKSTLMDALKAELDKYGKRVVRLDGDVVRAELCKDLGFSEKDRETNIKRVGFVAKMLSDNGVGVLCSFISPYERVRKDVSKNIKNYICLYLTASKKCLIERDPKGLYKKAISGEISGLTGFDGEYEIPVSPDIAVDTEMESLECCVDKIVKYLKRNKYI